MKNMSDDSLIHTYFRAIELDLNAHFIYLLKLEIIHRSLFNKMNELPELETTAL